MLKGLPASGKSTWAKEKINDGTFALLFGSELASLEITPLVAYGTQGLLLAIEGYLHWLWERSLVIHVEGNQDVILGQLVGY